MKRLFTILILLVSLSLCAQDSDQIKVIRDHYNYVNNNLNSFELKQSNVYDESTEGGEIFRYYDNGQCVKVRIEYFGETGKLFREYYVKENQLLFAFDQQCHYNMPFYMDSARAVQSGFEQWFDPNKTELHEHRFYFSQNKMIRWIDPSGGQLPSGTGEWIEKEQFYIEDLKSRLK